MYRFILTGLVVSLVGFVAIADDTKEELAKLSNKDLIAKYRSKIPAGTFAFYLNPVRPEVLCRGKAVVPELLALLKVESRVELSSGSLAAYSSPANDVIEILGEIGDPRAVPDLMDLLEGKDKKVDRQFRYYALGSVERITFCSMRILEPNESFAKFSIPLPDAIPVHRIDDLNKPAQTYRTWLKGEGKDPTQWLPLARERALKRLRSDDPEAIYLSAQFLLTHGGDRKQFVDVLAKVVGELKSEPKSGLCSYRGIRSNMPIGNWVGLLAQCGREARPHAALLIRIQKEHGENAWYFYADLRKVSGDKIMDHLIEVLPRITAEVAKLRADPKTPKGFGGSDPRGWWFDSQREVQLAIDLWAGRRFATDEDRVAWWKANRGGSREKWLTENLDTVVKQADKNDPWAPWVAREVMHDLPRETKDHVKWLAEHRSKLNYDPTAESFRLTPKGD